MDIGSVKRIVRETIKEKIIYYRKQNGYTQAKLGKLVGKSTTAVASWEQGASLPSINTLFDLASVFGVKVSDLMPKDDEVS